MADDFLIVGLGASAGGIKAFRTFFEQVTVDSGMAYVVILHLSPEYESRLPEVLQRSSVIPVTQVVDRVRVEPNHVYVLPPNQSLSMVDGHLALSPITRIEERRAPIDIFFRTLADCQGPRAASIVLSGTGADGSMGMKRVKESGGVCLVQEPTEADHEDMPRHSIATGLVDFVLPVAEMAAKLVAYRDHRSQLPAAREPVERLPEDEAAMRDIFTHLRVRTGHDFSSYKPATMLRRLDRRMRVHEISTLTDYAGFLRTNADEPQALLKDLLISVTNFFRDRAAFEALERTVIPAVLARKGPDDQVRIWIAGCATGEEAYSIAMLLAEHTAEAVGAPGIQLFATDIDGDAIATAREGFYTVTDAADVSPERLARFFIEESGGYRVRKELRSLVLFAYHNVIRDPPFSHLDLISCRNLLIYLNQTVQRRVAEVLHFALDPGRYLFLGSSESTEGSGDLFVTIDKDAHLFQARGASPRPVLTLPEIPRRVPAPRRQEVPILDARGVGRQTYADLHQDLLEQYAPPSMVVNEDYEILHLSARAGRYLRFAGGEPSRNLLRVVRPELRLELRTALYQAAQRRTNVEAHGLSLRVNELPETLTITVKPVLRDGDTARGFFLVLFEEGGPDDRPVPGITERIVESGAAAHQLEDELIRVRSQLRLTVEQYEAQAEELKASNEELQAINEELRSSAEELETSKEELQSINEELTTVNQELKIKIEEQTQSNNDILNLVNSTEIGTLFIDRDSRIKLFTQKARELFSLIPSDIGRPLSDISSTLEDTDLSADIASVLDSLRAVDREVRARPGRWYAMRLIPYRTADERIDGAVLTFVDITERKAAEHQLREAVERLRMAAGAAGMFSWELDLDRQLFKYYTSVEPVLGFALPEAAAGVTALVHPDDRAIGRMAQDEALASGVELAFDRRFLSPSGQQVWTRTSGLVLRDDTGRPVRIVGTTENVDDSKRIEGAIRESEQRLRESEARLRLILESILDYAVVAVDVDGCIESWNPGAERAFGYTGQEALAQHSRILFTDGDRQQGIPELEMTTAREEARAHADRWHVRKNGSVFFASGTLFPRRNGAGTLTGYVKIARDLTERKQYEDALKAAHDELEVRVQERTRELADANTALGQEVKERRAGEDRVKSLLKRLVTIQEDERRRIARDLHDHLGQQMTALRLHLDAAHTGGDTVGEMRERLEQADRIAERLDADVEFLAWELRPPGLDDIGLPGTLSKFLQEWSDHYGIAADLHVSGLDHQRLDPEVETSLYRIAQEALNNIFKHARAGRADVLLERRDNQVVLIIEDDGVGFDPSALRQEGDRGLGVIGMEERAVLAGGTLDIESQVGSGTTIYVRVPDTRS